MGRKSAAELTFEALGLDLDPPSRRVVEPFKTQLLKWIGNKQRFAHEIIAFFPRNIVTYHEPFLGSGAVLGTLAASRRDELALCHAEQAADALDRGVLVLLGHHCYSVVTFPDASVILRLPVTGS